MALDQGQLERLRPFSYDEWMLREMAARLHRERSLPVRNAFVESFLLHARNVAEFFIPKKRARGERDGPGVMDFVDGNYWGELTRLETGQLYALRDDVSEQVLHLTEKREGLVVGREWEPDAILAVLNPHVGEFAQRTGWEPYAPGAASMARTSLLPSNDDAPPRVPGLGVVTHAISTSSAFHDMPLGYRTPSKPGATTIKVNTVAPNAAIRLGPETTE